jgi:iron complex outermembrane recepter protein
MKVLGQATRITVLALASSLSVCSLAVADQGATSRAARDAQSLMELSLEDLLATEVTSVSKKETSLSESPAAIAVITQEDIRRHGITSLPEALRLVPGLEVARINSHSWAISARGFNGQYSDKLLVLLDGRVIYEARFPGVYWDVQDVVLEDLDRIEVIRGPGATLWGANAVNGVINIITKQPTDTRGAIVSTSIGTEEQPTTSVRYGGALSENVRYRVYGKLVNRDGLVDLAGAPAQDAWKAGRGGFRAEWHAPNHDTVTVQSEYSSISGNEYIKKLQFTAPLVQTVDADFNSRGANVLARWQHTISKTSDLSVQAFYADSYYWDDKGTADDDMADVEVTHRFSPLARHDVVWGAGYRHRASAFSDASRGIIWADPHHVRTLETGFVQDEIAIVPKRFTVTFGSKFEHNNDTGFSAHPSARFLWTPRHAQAVWGAVSKAHRTPDLFESGARLNVGAFQPGPQSPVMQLAMMGRPGLEPERMVSYEVGYRTEIASRLSFDVATFYSIYDNLIDFVAGAPMFEPTPVPHLLIPLGATNLSGGRSTGVEASAHWDPTRYWRVSPSYTYLHLPFLHESIEFDSPTHRASLATYVMLPKNFEATGAAYYVGELKTAKIPAYTRVDLGLTWRALQSVELGLWGQNLLDDRHAEFSSSTSPQAEAISRSVVARITWRPAGR